MPSSINLARPFQRFSSPIRSPFSSPASTSGSAMTMNSSRSGSARRSAEKKDRQREKEERLKQQREEIEMRRSEEEERAKREEDEETRSRYGADVHPQELCSISEMPGMRENDQVTFRARIHTQRRMSPALDFLLFRDQTDTIQGVLGNASPYMTRWVQRLSPESLVQVHGTLTKPNKPIRSATIPEMEVQIYSIHLIHAPTELAFDNYNAPDTRKTRLSNRVLDLRHPSNQALFKLRALMLRTWRRQLDDQGFTEINTPKLQPAATESGASVFKVNYFGRKAFLAQSPQLSKQMAISADMNKVYEIGPVFRAENSNTHRHLTEFTGLDIEMALVKDYSELVRTVDAVLKAMLAAIQTAPELEIVRKRFPSTNLKWLDDTLILPFTEGLRMLREDGRDVGDEEDLSSNDEIRLGELVKMKYDTDYFILDKFPTKVRPFYAMRDEKDPRYTNSFDIFLRGQEICTGGQRIHKVDELLESMRKADISQVGMEDYINAFNLSPPPHGGAGIGLERLMMLAFDLGDVRYGSLFHRDPKSLPEKAQTIPHPDADTLMHRQGDPEPSLENLIANYGDASNTSWLDDRFQIWRHKTGAAVGYVPQDRFAMTVGDPLCDEAQYEEVVKDYIAFVRHELKLIPIWMLVSEEVQNLLAADLGWRTLSCTEEQRIDPDHRQAPKGQHLRRIEREGIKIHEVRPSEDFRSRADNSIERWKASRKSEDKQVRLTDIRPWVDEAHRRYFAAENGNQVLAMVVLARLGPKHGWQIKWALDFPSAPNGTIEVLIETALSSVVGPITFGVGVAEKLTPGARLHGVRAKFLARTYDTIVKTLSLHRKSEFREKFGVQGESVYICYPRGGVRVKDFQQIVKFFKE
ncbi:putative aspartyl-trna synthetase protein [Zalerion maritima]|uniref:Probable aspartate--tRNA ligase, cytoplasmic n=1 Tax=Zalerion maritima TaxID=339359 RepID=A0AAD5WV82_9PEZI|nr:putative aspartyl-trna synthetase protein [Zalerion maritima]